MQKRKIAQAELEREEAEVKRNVKSLMRMTPESRALEDPVIADRVRNTRYEPQRYNNNEENEATIMHEKKSKPSKQKEEKPDHKSSSKDKKPNAESQSKLNPQQSKD